VKEKMAAIKCLKSSEQLGHHYINDIRKPADAILWVYDVENFTFYLRYKSQKPGSEHHPRGLELICVMVHQFHFSCENLSKNPVRHASHILISIVVCNIALDTIPIFNDLIQTILGTLRCHYLDINRSRKSTRNFAEYSGEHGDISAPPTINSIKTSTFNHSRTILHLILLPGKATMLPTSMI
jgi:hypothetical protein